MLPTQDSILLVTLGSEKYLCSPKSFTANLHWQPLDPSFEEQNASVSWVTPGVVVKVESPTQVTASWLSGKLDDMLNRDDVLTRRFFGAIIIIGKNSISPTLTTDLRDTLHSLQCSAIFTGTVPDLNIEGPVFVSERGLHKVFRLYDDPNLAFMCGSIPLDGAGEGYRTIPSTLIPVPSRLYFETPDALKPLNGVRVAVKDLIDVQGLPTTAGSRAYASLRDTASKSAVAIEKLMSLGAIVVGKTRTSQFAAGAEANYWVDFQCSFNPRGDTYQSTSGSTVGSAVAVAAYDWVDVGVGTDTLGSVVWPASAQGVYGLRFTFGALSQEGTVTVSHNLDTLGILGRSPMLLRQVASCWREAPLDSASSKKPMKLLWPSDVFCQMSPHKLKLMVEFVESVETTFAVKRTNFSMSQLWREKCPVEPYVPIEDYLDATLATIQLYGAWNNTVSFRRDFLAEHGHAPYADPTVKYKWSLGADITSEDHDAAISRAEVFAGFLKQHVFNENTLVFHPGGVYSFATSGLIYRDDYLGSPEEVAKRIQGYHYKNTFCSFLGGSPFLMVPIGQHLQWSRATQRSIYEPITIGVMGPKDSEVDLLRIVEAALKTKGRPCEVRTGSAAFIGEQP